MNSSQILAHIAEQARRAQEALTIRIGALAVRERSLREQHHARIFGGGSLTLDTAREFYNQPGANLCAEYSGSEIRKVEDEARAARALLRAGGLADEELAVALDSLTRADDFAGVARNALEQLCVLVRDEPGGTPRVLDITFPVSEETAAVEREARGRGLALAA